MMDHQFMPNEAGWNFDNLYSRLSKKFFTNLAPSPVRSPKLVMFNDELAMSLGLNAQILKKNGVEVFAGNEIPQGAVPLAQAYAGHQFGHFTMLGDGRALLLGEQITPTGERFDIQLKGSGRTPYSRGGDGRAALGPMLREYIISEAMHGLGIPTTRSLAVVTTGENVYRETALTGAILTRVASSHLRVGTFQYAANWGTKEDLQELADFAISRHFPEIELDDNRYLKLLKELIKRQASLISSWQLVGFIHGVMNTDNMTISGETIDYGPCAFMDNYNPETVFSSIDRHGRYAYRNQPLIAGWNLARFAEAILPLLHENEEKAIEIAQEEISRFPDLYQEFWLAGMRAKLGLFTEEEQDVTLVESLLSIMEKHKSDYTNTFSALTFDEYEEFPLASEIEFIEWKKSWQERLDRQKKSKESVRERMQSSNPSVIPRNHRVEEALSAAVNHGDYSVMYSLLKALSDPYTKTPEHKKYCTPPAPSQAPYRTFCGT